MNRTGVLKIGFHLDFQEDILKVVGDSFWWISQKVGA